MAPFGIMDLSRFRGKEQNPSFKRWMPFSKLKAVDPHIDERNAADSFAGWVWLTRTI